MPSLERRPGAPDAGRCDDPSVVEALEEVARAEARAEAARARVLQLTRDADAASRAQVGTMETVDPENTSAVEETIGDAEPASTRSAGLWRVKLRRPGRKSLAVGTAVVLICAAVGISGYAVWYHHKTVEERERAAEFAAAARQGAVTLMSIDPNKARDDVQRIIDDSTGPVKAGIMISAEELVKAVEQSKVGTKVAVKGVAVESMTDNSAVVLVAARAEVANPGKDALPPRLWRMVMDLQRDAGRIKMSKVEFVP